MIVFNRNDGADIQEQLTYLNSLPQYKLFRLRAVREQMKTYDFWNDEVVTQSSIGILPSIGISAEF